MPLDPELAKVKKKKDPPLEKKVKNRLANECKKLAKALGYKCFVDWPPASEFGMAGRPDAFIYIGPHLFLVEVKRDKTHATLSPKQMNWLIRHAIDHGDLHDKYRMFGPEATTVYGYDGVDRFITNAAIKIVEREELWDIALAHQHNMKPDTDAD